LDSLINASTDYLIRYKVIDPDDRDVYDYGFHALYNNIIDIISIVTISALLHQIPQTVIYHISFVILRNTAGGFHAKTRLRCFIMSTIIWLLSLWGISQTASPVICIGLAGISALLIWTKAPIEHVNSPLSEEKYRRMRALSRIASMVFFIAVVFSSTMTNNMSIWIAASLAYGMASHALLVLRVFIMDF
jgi:accessory gene regulator B